MSVNEEWELVVRLACLTEDRTDGEQRALLNRAFELDCEHNKNVGGNHAVWGDHAGSVKAVPVRPPLDLVALVDGTRLVSDFPGDRQHRVWLTKKQEATRARLLGAFKAAGV